MKKGRKRGVQQVGQPAETRNPSNGTPATPSAPPMITNTLTDAEEARLRIKKLSSEATWGIRLEVFKTVAGVIAALGVIGTLALTLTQQRQNRLSRDDDRFDRSVSRVGSNQVSERLTGLAGLQQFLNSNDVEHTRSALLYLINSVSIETDATVRSAILDTFNSLSNSSLSSDALNAALASARDRNRALYRQLKTRPWTATKDKPTYNVDFPELAMDPIQPQEKDELLATGAVIAALVRAGAKMDDLSEIFCMGCDFSSSTRKVDLSGTKFELAMLRGARFLSVDLDGASFHNADLVATDFTSASLRNAKLATDSQLVPYALQAAYATRNLMNIRGANFACSDLRGADLSGQLLFGLIYDDPIFGGFARDEFFQADVRDTNFIGGQFFVAMPRRPFRGSEVPQELSQESPISSVNASMAGPTEGLDYVDAKYFTWIARLNPDSSVTVPLKSDYRRSLIMLLSSLGFARNVSDAKLPASIVDFVTHNKEILDKPAKSYDCKGQMSFDITQLFNPDDVGPKNTQF